MKVSQTLQKLPLNWNKFDITFYFTWVFSLKFLLSMYNNNLMIIKACFNFFLLWLNNQRWLHMSETSSAVHLSGHDYLFT